MRDDWFDRVTELHVYAGEYHGFHFATDARVTATARRDSVSALERALGGPASSA